MRHDGVGGVDSNLQKVGRHHHGLIGVLDVIGITWNFRYMRQEVDAVYRGDALTLAYEQSLLNEHIVRFVVVPHMRTATEDDERTSVSFKLLA